MNMNHDAWIQARKAELLREAGYVRRDEQYWRERGEMLDGWLFAMLPLCFAFLFGGMLA